jgi:hypothetical protein
VEGDGGWEAGFDEEGGFELIGGFLLEIGTVFSLVVPLDGDFCSLLGGGVFDRSFDRVELLFRARMSSFWLVSFYSPCCSSCSEY